MAYLKFIIITIIVAFVAWFVIGIIAAAFLGRKKHRNAYGVRIISKISNQTIEHLVKLFKAHKNGNIKEVNQTIFSIGSDEMHQLLTLLGPQTRPTEFSAGKFGNELSWTAMETALQKKGYTVKASKLIAGIVLHSLDEILPKLKK